MFLVHTSGCGLLFFVFIASGGWLKVTGEGLGFRDSTNFPCLGLGLRGCSYLASITFASNLEEEVYFEILDFRKNAFGFRVWGSHTAQ